VSGYRSALYAGTVMHSRREPVDNTFRYPVYMTLIDLDELPRLDRELPLFGWNRAAPTSFCDRDHFDVLAFLESEGVELGAGPRIEVLTNLRVLGHVFNPVSFWWCRRADGELAGIVAEVNNTFGERLPYLLRTDDATVDATARRRVWETEKRLHVSPFMGMEQSYTWRCSEAADRVDVRMDVHEHDRRDFVATLTARRVELTAASLRAALVRQPLMPLRVISRIHLQAGRLALKRVPFVRKPPFVAGEGSART
jgi:DUF1365 family protein